MVFKIKSSVDNEETKQFLTISWKMRKNIPGIYQQSKGCHLLSTGYTKAFF